MFEASQQNKTADFNESSGCLAKLQFAKKVRESGKKGGLSQLLFIDKTKLFININIPKQVRLISKCQYARPTKKIAKIYSCKLI